MKPVTVDALDPLRGATLTVHVRLRNVWRLRLGVLLIRAAAWVLGCGVVVVKEEPGNSTV